MKALYKVWAAGTSRQSSRPADPAIEAKAGGASGRPFRCTRLLQATWPLYITQPAANTRTMPLPCTGCRLTSTGDAGLPAGVRNNFKA